jgi:hypothetical protein
VTLLETISRTRGPRVTINDFGSLSINQVVKQVVEGEQNRMDILQKFPIDFFATKLPIV